MNQTRSGQRFSPYAGVINSSTAFDFEGLVRAAIRREDAFDDDFTEGYLIEPAFTPFSSPTPLSPVPDDKVPGSPIPSDLAQLPTPELAPEAAPLSPPIAKPQPQRAKDPGHRVERARRKDRAKALRALKRELSKRTGGFGDYAVKPKVLQHHVRPAIAVSTQLKSEGLKHTKNAYTGGRDKGGYGRVFRLEELVGADSKLGFTLEKWDGR